MSQKYEIKATAVSQVSTTDSGDLKQISTPTIFPLSGFNKLYFKSDNNLYKMNSSGTETAVEGGGGGGGGTLWTKYTKTYTDFAIADSVNIVNIFTLNAKTVLKSIIVHHTQNFIGGVLADYSISLGISGNWSKYTDLWGIFGGQSGTRFQNVQFANLVESMSASTVVQAYIVSNSDFLNAATQGSVDIYVESETLP